MARATPSEVRDELDVSSSEYPDSEADVDIRRANYIVNNRIADRVDDTQLLTDIEILVAAHLAHDDLVDSVKDGREISQAQQGSRNVSFNSDSGEIGPGGYSSPYWGEALTLDPTGRLGVHTRIADSSSTN